MNKILEHIQFTQNAAGSQCKQCNHFENDPDIIEKTFKGLTTLSSGYASVRAGDGLCNLLNRYLSSKDSCANFSPLNLNSQIKSR